MEVVSQVSVLFLLIIIGYIACKLKLAGREAAGYFSMFIINLTLPAMLLVSFQRPFIRELLGEAGIALAAATGIYAASFALAVWYPRLLGMRGPERGVHRYAVIFSNCGFMGYPVVEAALGPDALFHAVVYNIPFHLLAYSLGAWFISKEGNRPLRISWKTFINPSVAGTFAGFALFVCSISLPQPLFRCLKMLGDITSPLSMIVIGVTLAQANVRQVFGRWQIYLTVLARLLILPLLAAAGCYALGLRGPLLTLAVLITAMPAGSTTSILSSLYNAAPEEGGSLVFLSTMFSMITIPLVIFMMNRFAPGASP